MKNNKGFTLLEIISVVTIIVMLAIIVAPIIDRNIKDAQNLASDSQTEMIEKAAFIYAVNFRNEIPALDTNKVATVDLYTLLEKGLLEEKSLKTISGGELDTGSFVVIAIVENSIKTIYQRKQQGNPIIVLHGPQKITMKIHTIYEELGASLIILSPASVSELELSNIESGVDNNTLGTYEVTYSYSGAETIKRTVVVSSTNTSVDNEKPIITINGSSSITISKGTSYTDAGAIAEDLKDGTITTRIVTTGSVNTKQKGTYYIKYDVTDLAGNKADTVIRTVTVN